MTNKENPMPDLLVWWLFSEEIEAADSIAVEEYIVKEMRSLDGRNGRGRLWVPQHIECESLPDMGFFPWKLEQRGGIVFEKRHYQKSMSNYGYVTDVCLREYDDGGIKPFPDYAFITSGADGSGYALKVGFMTLADCMRGHAVIASLKKS